MARISMRSIDCEYLAETNWQCRNEKLNNDWFHGMFPRQCIEHKFDFVTCKERLSVWDMLKNQQQAKKRPAPPPSPQASGQIPPGGVHRPPPPPAPPPKRVFYNNARVYPEDDEDE